jgi:hypothetical protein
VQFAQSITQINRWPLLKFTKKTSPLCSLIDFKICKRVWRWFSSLKMKKRTFSSIGGVYKMTQGWGAYERVIFFEFFFMSPVQKRL